MASVTLAGVPWPATTTVGAFPDSAYTQSQRPVTATVGRSGTATGTAAVGSDSSLTISSLTEGAKYYLMENTGTVTAVRTITAKTDIAAGSTTTTLTAGGATVGNVGLVAGTADVGAVNHDVTGISSGRTVVTTAGTRVVLAASTAAKYAIISAALANTGVVVIGGTGVVAAVATRQGIPLSAGDSVTVPCDNLNDINVDAMVSGEAVIYGFLT